MLAFSWSDLADLALAVFLFLVGAGLAYALFRLGATLGRASAFIKGTENELLPVIGKVGETIDRVNEELDKVDKMTDSAADAVESVDHAVRATSAAVSGSAKKLSGVASGIRHGFSSVKSGKDVRSAVRIAKEEAARRESEIEQQLREAD